VKIHNQNADLEVQVHELAIKVTLDLVIELLFPRISVRSGTVGEDVLAVRDV
tara:strand:+ start:40 stop:195 length:156 start_codon:yes stop_codon:yes gene_type:complete